MTTTDDKFDMNLGQMLRWHRSHCPACTSTRACPEYLDIAREYTQPRQIYAGPVAASTTLTVRETIP